MGEKEVTEYISSIRLEKALNLRDVGRTVNLFLGRRVMFEGRVFRSARPDEATDADKKIIRDELGIKTIIDFRTKSEHIKQAERRAVENDKSGAVGTPPQPGETTALQQIPGVEYIGINLNGRGFEMGLVRKLSWSSMARMSYLMLLGRRMEGIAVLAKEVMTPRGLIGLGIDTCELCGAEIALTFNTLHRLLTNNTGSEEAEGGVLLHCTLGKDRTGLISALLLLLLSVPLEAVTHDYTLSATSLTSERESRLAELREMGFSDEFADCPGDWIGELEGWLEERWGGVEGFLRGAGVGAEVMRGLREVLLVGGSGVGELLREGDDG